MLTVLIAAIAGAVIGGALVWRWSSQRAMMAPESLAAAAEPMVDVVTLELERARRFERPFALVRAPLPDGPVPGPDALQPLCRTLRAVDVAWIDPVDGLHVLLPELDRNAAERCVRRLRETVPHLVADARVAVFPVDGLTRGALLGVLHDDPIDIRQPEPILTPAPVRIGKAAPEAAM